MNPFTVLDTFLNDYASPKIRRVVHLLITLAAVVVAIWFAADGDWKKFAAALAAAIYAEANKANTDTVTPVDAHAAPEPDDGLTYEESGGEPFPEGDQPVSLPE